MQIVHADRSIYKVIRIKNSIINYGGTKMFEKCIKPIANKKTKKYGLLDKKTFYEVFKPYSIRDRIPIE